jgi:hypothetical protein
MYSCVTLLQRGVSSWCCAYFFALYILKGYLENTEKDRIKRLIRLKPPTEFWMRNSEANVIESAISVVWWASCELEWHVTKARQIFYSLVWCRREDFGWPLNTIINILNLTIVFCCNIFIEDFILYCNIYMFLYVCWMRSFLFYDDACSICRHVCLLVAANSVWR